MLIKYLKILKIKRKILLNNKNTKYVIIETPNISGIDMIRIGNGSRIGPNSYISAEGGLNIGSNVIFGPGAIVWTRNHNFINANMLPYDERITNKPVIIGDGCWFGEGVKIAPGAKIGRGVIAAMGSVIFGEIPEFSIINGNPATIIKIRNDINNFNKLDPINDSYIINKINRSC